jgi:hypothetical protein
MVALYSQTRLAAYRAGWALEVWSSFQAFDMARQHWAYYFGDPSVWSLGRDMGVFMSTRGLQEGPQRQQMEAFRAKSNCVVFLISGKLHGPAHEKVIT